MSAEQILSSIDKLASAILGKQNADEDKKRSGRRLELKGMTCGEFTGRDEDWEEWSFAFKSGIRSQSPEAYKLLMRGEESTDILTDDVLDLEDDRISGELFALLGGLCKGSAQAILRKVEDCQGIQAWQLMHQSSNPKTMARTLRILAEVTRPSAVKELAEVEAAMDKWEDSVKKLVKGHKENMSPTMKLAIFTSFMPDVVKDYIYTNIDESTSYETISQKVRTLVKNKVGMNGSMPMDLGMVAKSNVQTHEHYVYEKEEDWGEDVGAVGLSSQCYQCLGWGHIRRDCPTKGKAKGSTVPGKAGYQKASWGNQGKSNWASPGLGKGFGKGYQGKGKGYQGACFNCGEVGHKKAECPKAVHGVDEHEVGTVELDGVWMIAEVSCEDVVTKKRAASKIRARTTWTTVTQNMWEALEEKDEPMELMIAAVDISGKKLTRIAAMTFNEADVKKPLASAVAVAKAGNKIIVDEKGGYIENMVTGEKMELRIQDNTYVYDIQMEDGSINTVILDSGAACNVWPRSKASGAKLMPRKEGIKMVAANGTSINYYGQRLIKFRGMEADQDFPRRV